MITKDISYLFNYYKDTGNQSINVELVLHVKVGE